jgi:Protein of unknown function (DUF4238)
MIFINYDQLVQRFYEVQTLCRVLVEIKNGVPLHDTQSMPVYKSSKTTEIYTHVTTKGSDKIVINLLHEKKHHPKVRNKRHHGVYPLVTSKFMKKQNQHRISQVYLKEFGYITEGGQWKISSLEVDKFQLMRKRNKLFFSQKSIESVTANNNIFDLIEENINSTLFEDLNGKIETWYPQIIYNIKSSSKLSVFDEGILIQFIPNLLCRVETFRQLIKMHLDSSNREYFLKSMCAFQKVKGIPFIKKINSLSIEAQINPTCFVVMDHIMNKLSYFDYVIVREYANRGWITSDNPVVLNNNISDNSIFSINTELYFPLSKDYCIFFSHPNANKKNNVLRMHKNKSLIDATEEIQELIYEKIRINAEKLIFFPTRIEEKFKLE